MPKIYKDDQRNLIYEALLVQGLAALKRGGLKGINIGALTKEVGIAQGTFYNFFESKEHLVYTLGDRYSQKNQEFLGALIRDKKMISRDDLRRLYCRMMLEDEDNAYRYLSREDLTLLKTRLNPKFVKTQEVIFREMAENLKYVENRREDVDLVAVFNWIQLMNLCLQNADVLGDAGSREKMMGKLIDNMIEEIV